jgi:acetolactate synthase I/II/III large subunit
VIRVADYIAGHLEAIGVKDVFLLSGGGMMHLIDAISRVKGIDYHCCHHEQACAMAAESYARLKGSLGVCYATSGPGGTNTLTGVVGAWLDSAPVLFITGQSNVRQSIRGSGIKGLRQFGTFEVDIVPIMESVTKYAVFLDDPSKARYHLEKAIYLAQGGRPGPVLLDIPLNVQGAMIDPQTLAGFTPPPSDAAPSTNAPTMQGILHRIRNAKRPLILAGHGVRVADAVEQFASVIRMLNIPVVTTQLGKDILHYDHPLFIGHPGVKGDRASGFAVQNADLLIILGCSLHNQTTGYEMDLFAPNAYKIQVDLDEAVLQREQVGVAQKIRSGVKEFLILMEKLLPEQERSLQHAQWLKRCQMWKTKYDVMNEPHDLSDGPVNYYEFQDVLSTILRGDEVILADAGSAFYIFGQAFKLKRAQRYIASGGLATMGYTLPACIGAACADPSKTIIGLTGDGSFHMNAQELAVVRHANLNVKLFVLNNEGYSCIRNTQDAYFSGHHVGTDAKTNVSFPAFNRLAEAYDLPFIRCNDRSELGDTVRKALQTDGPVFCEVMCQFNQPFLPVLTSEKKEDGTLVAKALHELAPFLSEEEVTQNMQHDDAPKRVHHAVSQN